jgi:DNA-binding phage protein
MLKQRNAAFDNMTATELKVYQLYYVDGILNISNLARQAGISRVTAYKTLHNLSSKYGLTFTVDKENKIKN